jgi:hypothetical protein
VWAVIVGSFGGAAGGALSVLALQLWVERRRRRLEEVLEQRRVQFALSRRYATLTSVWNQWLSDANTRFPSEPWLVLPPPVPGPARFGELNLDPIAFTVTRAPNLSGMIFRDEEDFRRILDLIRLFTLQSDEISSRVERWDVENGLHPEGIPLSKIRELAGPRLSTRQKTFFRSLLEGIPHLRSELWKRISEVNDFVNRHYKTSRLTIEEAPPEFSPTVHRRPKA